MKIAAIESLSRSSRPHALVIGETKSTHRVSSRIRLRDYTVHENPGRPSNNSRHGKWGVLLAVHRGISCGQPLPLPSCLNGRAIALDVIIPTANNRGFPHRIVGIYAPWDPGVDPDASNFWPSIADICNSSPFSWSLHGDFNATLSFDESSASSRHVSPSRAAYSSFLNNTGGMDLWRTIPDRRAATHYTFQGPTSTESQVTKSIIDRSASSRRGVLSGTIDILKHFIPCTDHLPIVSHLVLSSPPDTRGCPAVPDEVPPSVYAPRYRYPTKGDAYRFEKFTDSVNHQLDIADISNVDISDDATFDDVYSKFTHALLTAAADAFILPKTRQFPSQKPLNPTISVILTELKRTNRIISAINTFLTQGTDRFPNATWVYQYHDAFLRSHPPDISMDGYRNFMKGIRRQLNKLRFAEERICRMNNLEAQSSRQIASVLRGGSAKRLYSHQFSTLPLAIAPSPNTNPDHIVTGPDGVKHSTRQYFQDLYSRTSRPPQPKPWMTTPSVQQVASRIRTDPFQWPRQLHLSELRQLLAKGNTRPTPGPDGWEKWMIRKLPDHALDVVLRLANFVIMTSHFPPSVKDTNISTIHKRGSPISLSNYRGIACNNFLLNLPFAWLNSLLNPYITKHSIIPQTQIATQPGIQGRDLISFISQVQKWANRTRTPLYILQRDQKKGFDMLEPQGFHDAIIAYGLPESIIRLDVSSQANVPYRVKTAYGFTTPFNVNGVTKQGGSLSPLKCTLTTSLGNRWLTDLQSGHRGEITITSINAARHGTPHTPHECAPVRVSMIEAMDDSLLPLMGGRRNGGRVFSTPTTPPFFRPPSSPTISIPSVDYHNPSSPVTIYNDVNVVTDHTVFLRVPIDQPDLHFAHLNDLIDDFDFPVLHKRLPLTALRRIISQSLISKIRPLLTFQPISRALAQRLDQAIALKVHNYLGFPFIFKADLLSLPVPLRGFGFPSLSTLNDALAVSGLHRDLNHHVPIFRDMAQITLADWTCQYNHCSFPLSAPGIHRLASNLSRHIPHSWPTAQTTLRELSLSLSHTDLSFITTGSVNIQHLYSLSCSTPAFTLPHDLIPSRTFNNFLRFNMSTLSHFGTWITDPDTGLPCRFSPINLPPVFPYFLHRDWPLFISWFSFLPAIIYYLSHPDRLLLLPRQSRQLLAENVIRTLHRGRPAPFDHSASTPNLLASDASLSTRSPTNRPSVTFAVVAQGTILASTLDDFLGSATILRGEAYGIAVAHILSSASPSPHPQILYTDHLNSVNLINSFPIENFRLASNPARSIYRWTQALSQRAAALPAPNLRVEHIRAHTSSQSVPATLNRLADHVASSYRRFQPPPPPAPVPTFFMDEYTLYSQSDGWIESNISDFVQSRLFRLRSQSLPSFSSIYLPLYDHRSPPDYPYTHACSSYSAVVQLYLRADQLDTAARLSSRMRSGQQPYCRFGCPTIEDARHIFVHCPRFAALRSQMDETNASATATLLDVSRVPHPCQARTLDLARTLTGDSESWPLGFTMYYYGIIPKLDDISSDIQTAPLTTLQVERLRLRISSLWHTACIRLAGRIWGIVKRTQRERVLPLTPPPLPQSLTLPSHLSHTISLSSSNKFSLSFV
ncbi:hypothetical protein D9615_002408 [Tricholomella constricta]|uniref:Reverse transcriptase domain-containing protein n=1 Tax=Tricholomella constricta TaxID=117010 RepID=A0A8H5HMA3_9AGAR|nr:hypothetical protein D9615_002408 [Tricholomella constricta]